MTLEEVKAEVRMLTPAERRAVVLYVMELERDRFADEVVPQITEDIEAFSRTLKESAEKIRQRMTGTRP